jgi:hypothetical protein
MLNDEFYDELNSLFNFGEISIQWSTEEKKKINDEISPVNDYMERPSINKL